MAEVPGDAVEAAGPGAHDAADGVAGGVPYEHCDARAVLKRLGGEAVVAGEGDVLAALGGRLLRFAALFAQGRGGIGEPVGEGCAEVRVGRDERGCAQGRLAGRLQWGVGDVPPGVPHGEQNGSCRKRTAGHISQGSVVVEDVEATAKGCPHQVTVAALNFQISERDGGSARPQQDPIGAPVRREIDAVLGAEE